MRPVGFVPVEAKFRPPAQPSGLVLRGQLVDRLLEARDCPLVLLAAPPGYGKSVVVTQWAGEDDRPFAWLTLDQADNDPLVLITYVVLSLHRVEPVEAGIMVDAASAADVLQRLLPALRRRQPFVLVVDAADALTAPEAIEVLQVLGDNLPDGAQLALVGRTVPAVGWRSRTTEVGTADLKLSRAEALALVRGTGLALADHDVEELLRRTEGWAAGMYLATLSLGAHGHQPPSVASVVGRDSLIAGYLRDQVLDLLAPEDQELLVRTSILTRLSGPLCDAVLLKKKSGESLQRLAQANVLLFRMDDQGRWFRLHQLFGEALRTELLHREPQLVKSLHSRASLWFEAAGNLDEAIAHAIDAMDVARAAHLIWRHTPACVATGRLSRLERWLGAFTARQVGTHAKLSLAAAWLALERGRPAEHWVSAAVGGQYEAAVKGEAESVASATALLRAVLARNGLVQMAADAMLAVRLQEPGDPWFPVATLLEAVATYLTGHTAEAHSKLADAEGLAAATGAHATRAAALAQLVLVALDDGDLDTARVLTEQAMDLLRAFHLEDSASLLPVHCVASLVAARSGRTEEAAALSRECLRRVALTAHPAPWGGVQCRLVLARTELLLGEPPAARTLLSEAQELLPQVPDATFLRDAVESTWHELEAIPLDRAGRGTTLTSAELRVLQYLPTHLSFEEIGRQLFVSRNTVKTQAVAAYRKLGVSSRSEAVDRARSLGLLTG